MKLSFKIAELIFRVLVKVFMRLEVKGKENIPQTGPVIIASNHIHLMDPPLLILSILPRKSSFMAKEELFQTPFYSTLMHIAEAFPIRRSGTDEDRKAAIQQAVQVLERGLVLGMFPEGTRSRNGQLKRGYPGVAIIAVRTGAPIIPVAVTGTEKLRAIGWLRRPKVTIKFGRPFVLPKVKGELTRLDMRQLTDSLMKGIAALLPAEYRGEYRQAVESGD